MHSAWPAVTFTLPSFKVSLPHVLRIVPPCTPHGGTGCNFCFRERRDWLLHVACVSTLYTTRQFIGVLSAARLRRVYDQRGACFDRPPDSSSAAADFCAINRRISRPTNAASRLPVSALNSAAVFHWLIAYKSLLSGPGRLPVYKSIRPGRAGEYCDKGVCLFICLSARPFQEPHIQITEFSTVCMLPAAVARPWSYRKFSALLCWRCDTLCIYTRVCG